MMRIPKLSLLLLFLPALFMACNNDAVFPVEPQIEFLDITPKVVRPWPIVDTINITFRFQDGDGNLGNQNDMDQNFYLFLIDTRYKQGLFTKEQATSSYRLPNMSPDAKNPSIQGKITVQIYGTVLSSLLLTEETTSYEIELKDRAGNKATRINDSGTPDPNAPIVTEPILIKKP